jgi:hypothetical protein
MYYAQAMNLKLAAQGDPEANCWAERCRQAFKRDSLLNLQYNKEIAGGKWDGYDDSEAHQLQGLERLVPR